MIPVKGGIDRKTLLVKSNGDFGIPLGNRFLPRFPEFLCG